MEMTKGEIVREYKAAKSKKRQIQILADMNQCPVDTIEKILIDEGALVKKQKIAPVQQNPVEEPKEDMIDKFPKAVINAIFCRIDALDELIRVSNAEISKITEQIKEYESEYRELVSVLK